MPTQDNSASGPVTPGTQVLASSALAAALRERLARYLPFSQMRPEHVDEFLAASSEVYFEPGEVILQAESGPVDHLYFLRQGSVTGHRGPQSIYDANIEYVTGDLFPVAA
ncbi:MAG: nucleotidyltransferase, partial [Betaproteobacteria bacterium]|nr:nucleotidyltransferase [Betaproteobacteria bacterium]